MARSKSTRSSTKPAKKRRASAKPKLSIKKTAPNRHALWNATKQKAERTIDLFGLPRRDGDTALIKTIEDAALRKWGFTLSVKINGKSPNVRSSIHRMYNRVLNHEMGLPNHEKPGKNVHRSERADWTDTELHDAFAALQRADSQINEFLDDIIES